MGCHARVLAVAVTVSGGDAACGRGRDRTRDCSSKSARPRVTDGAGEGRRLPTPGGRRPLAGRTPAGQGGPPSPPSFENLVVPTVVHFGGSGRCHARYGRRGDGCEDPHTGRLTRSAGSCLKPPRPAGLARAEGGGRGTASRVRCCSRPAAWRPRRPAPAYGEWASEAPTPDTTAPCKPLGPSGRPVPTRGPRRPSRVPGIWGGGSRAGLQGSDRTTKVLANAE